MSEPKDMPGTPAGGYTPERAARVRGLINEALANTKAPRRHRADVTADRLTDDVIAWGHLFTGAEADSVAEVVQVLREIADGTRREAVR